MSADFSSAFMPVPPDVANSSVHEYVSFKMNVSRDYEEQSTDAYEIISEGIAHIRDNPLDNLKKSALRGDTAAKLDMGMRQVCNLSHLC